MSKRPFLSQAAARAPRSLDDQLSDTARECVAVLLGFSSCEHASGFRMTLNEIAPLPLRFTIGDALQAYLAHLLARQCRAKSTRAE